MIKVIGTIGAICFAICALPVAIQSVTDGHSNGQPWSFLLLWLIGELFTFYYVFRRHGVDIPLFFNYTLNIVFISIVIYFKLL